MWHNIRWRLGMWAHHLLDRWQWRCRITRPPERFTPRFKNMDGQDD